jgi:hypothetical protein
LGDNAIVGTGRQRPDQQPAFEDFKGDDVMTKDSFVWLTDGHGVVTADVNGYVVSVERLYPASEVRFIVWGAGSPVGSGVRSSPNEAMLAAEQMAWTMSAGLRHPRSDAVTQSAHLSIAGLSLPS